jgi:hypothetical protein
MIVRVTPQQPQVGKMKNVVLWKHLSK